MDIKDYKVQKFLMGCFYESDFSYNQNKGNLLNKAKKLFNDNQLAYLEHQEIGDILVSKKNQLQIRLTNSSMHFEGNFNKEIFLARSTELFNLHNEILPESAIKKIGFIVYFEKNESQNDDLFKKYFTNIKITDVSNINFRLNYAYTINDTVYNVNLTLKKDETNINVNGEIDFNISQSDNIKLSIEIIPKIFNDLYTYYKEILFDHIDG